jgi:hypothetical protein
VYPFHFSFLPLSYHKNQPQPPSIITFPFSFLSVSHQPSPKKMNSTPIHKFSTPKGEFLEPPQSSKPITASSYEFHLGFIAMVQEQSFSGQEDENPYDHLQEFEQLCSCLSISGMTHETIKWKLFPFSLCGRVKQ